jgi:arylsulfatase A-like enzyme
VEPGEFQGTIGRYYDEATAWWPDPPRPPDGAPNVVMIVLDDVGFAQLGCFGSDIATPNIDALAAGGLRYTNFHTTALCSPTRSCLLTGRNHHLNGMGRVVELAMGFPGYDARISRANGFLSEMLLPHGYATYAVGKWHLAPEEDAHQAASRARWPLGRGFERFYGIFGGETHQYAPPLVSDNHQIQPPKRYDEGYHFTTDLVDQATEMVSGLRAIDDSKPFFLYFATGACHSPHHVRPEWIERYRGQFDRGWDVWREETFARQRASGLLAETTQLSPRPDWVPAWDDLNDAERRLFARYMEVFAGFLSHTDHEIGRLVDTLRGLGVLDDTLIFVLSDNGASSEGGPTGSTNDIRLWNMVGHNFDDALARMDKLGGPRLHNNYPWGWTVAGNTPFRRWKREVHEGGVADPLIVHWPNGISDPGASRRQYVHAVDCVPTVLDVLGIDAPAYLNGTPQRPLSGVSFAPTIRDGEAADAHETQYYEMFGCRAIYHRGWKAVTWHPIQMAEPPFDQDHWELYDVTADPSECNDLSAEHPDKVRELVELWWQEAERNNALPIDNRPFSDLVFGRPTGLPARKRYEYRPGLPMVPEHAAVNVRNRDHQITAYVADNSDGMLLSMGNVLGGFAFFVHSGLVSYVHNFVALEEHRVQADVPLAAGAHRLQMRFRKTGEHRGAVDLLVDGDVVATGEVPRFTPTRFSLVGQGLTCGYSVDCPVCDDYAAPFTHPSLERVVVDVDGQPFLDPEAEAEVAITTQ